MRYALTVMRVLLVATLAALAVALPTGYHRKSSANFEDKLDRDAERMHRVTVDTELSVKSKIGEAVKLLKDTLKEKDWSAKKRKIKSNILIAENMLRRAGDKWAEHGDPDFSGTDALDNSAFAVNDREEREWLDKYGGAYI